MPIHDLGYRAWQGRTVAEILRWWVITETGIRLAWRNRWLRRILWFAWAPALFIGSGFFAYEQWMINPAAQQVGERIARQLLEAAPSSDRHEVWAWLLMSFFRYPQAMLMLLIVGLIAPPLIAQDVRTRAFLLYFSRPITRIEYLVGKLATMWAYLALITTLPALALYVFAVLLSPEIGVVVDTWDLPIRVLAASAVLMIPTTTLALAFSSLTSDTRYAAFAWFATWGFGWVTYGFLFSGVPGVYASDNWTLISLYHTLGEVQTWVFGVGQTTSLFVSSTVVLLGISVLSLMVLFHRISSPMRV
jgi:hypothetical protein